jgi:parafibromin
MQREKPVPNTDLQSCEFTDRDNLDVKLGTNFPIRRSTGETSSSKNCSRHRPERPVSQEPDVFNRGQRGGPKSSATTWSASGSSKVQYITDGSEKSKTSASTITSWDQTSHHAIDPPRPPKLGMEWVWFPQGYWAERELHGIDPPSIGSSNQSSRSRWWNRSPEPQTPSPFLSIPTGPTDNSQNFPSKPSSPRFDIPRIKLKGSSRRPSSIEGNRRRSSSQKSMMSLQLGGFAFIKPQIDSHDSGEFPQETLGLYCRAKNNIRGLLQDKPKLVGLRSQVQ